MFVLLGTGRSRSIKGDRQTDHTPLEDILFAKLPSQLATLATWPGRCGLKKKVWWVCKSNGS